VISESVKLTLVGIPSLILSTLNSIFLILDVRSGLTTIALGIALNLYTLPSEKSLIIIFYFLEIVILESKSSVNVKDTVIVPETSYFATPDFHVKK